MEKNKDGFDGVDIDSVELIEIAPGLPTAPADPALLEAESRYNRHLVEETRKLERKLLQIDRVDALLAEIVAGLQRVLACRRVELILHDPVQHLSGLLKDPVAATDGVFLTPDSHAITSVFPTGVAEIQWLSREQIMAREMLVKLGGVREVVAIPLVESGVVVGSLYCADPALDLLGSAANCEWLVDFGRLVPLTIRLTADGQVASEMMLLDPETHFANRAGLERDLEREIGRARRAGKAISLIAISLCALEDMGNLSQRHLRAQVLRQIANRLNQSLRAADSMGRIAPDCFGVLIVDAPPDTVRDIAWRFSNDIRGLAVDDGVGGVVEADPSTSFISLGPGPLPDRDIAELAAVMIDVAAGASSCRLREKPGGIVEVSLPDEIVYSS